MIFSLSGAAIVAVLLFPSLLYLIFPPEKHPPKRNPSAKPLFLLLDRGGQIASATVLMFSKPAFDAAGISIFTALMMVTLFFYLILWMRYFTGGRNFAALKKDFLFIPLPLAVYPVIALFSAAAWIGSLPLAASAAVFAVGHIYAVYHTT